MMMMMMTILGKMTWLFHEVATGADVLVELANQLLHPHLCKFQVIICSTYEIVFLCTLTFVSSVRLGNRLVSLEISP